MLILLRHGRTRLNAEGRLQGRVDEPLDEVGRAQAQAAAAYVGAVDEIIVSPLLRAQETAAAFGQSATVDERWIELGYGEFEGELMGAVPSEAWTRWRADSDWRPEGGETITELEERVWAACDELFERAQGDRRVLVVSHVSPIKAAAAWTLGIGKEFAFRSHLSPGSVTRIDLRPSGAVLHSFNEPVPQQL